MSASPRAARSPTPAPLANRSRSPSPKHECGPASGLPAGCGSADMSVGVDDVGVAHGAGPDEGAEPGADVGPPAVGLVAVVASAQGREVPALGAADRPGEDVVHVLAA